MRTVHASLGAVAVGLIAVRAFVACGSDDDGGGSTGLDNVDGGSDRRAPTPDDDTGTNDPALPSFCNGITLYASFDSAFALQRGTAEARPAGGAELTQAGRFGGGIALYADAGDAGASLYWVRPNSGAALVPEDKGSFAAWYRSGLTAPTDSPVVYRIVDSLPPDPLAPRGLILAGPGSRFGLFHQGGSGQASILAFEKFRLRPYLRREDFNHIATTWHRGAGANPSATMVINGGLGEVFLDGGTDADPSVDGGTLFRASSSAPWDDDAGGPALALRLGGPNTSAAQGVLDDVAMWDRELSFEEIEALYRSNAAIGETCRLK